MRIRAFRRGDAKGFLDLVRALARYEKLKPPGEAEAKRLVRDIGRRIRVLVVEEEGGLIAYEIHFLTYSSFLARPTLYLEDLFVLPEHRHRGIGRRLFDALSREARRAGCGRMEWMALGWNKVARRFYEKLGARPLSEWVTYRMSL
jgi:GNAT superfamily N-acetyltransferase